jgi:pimeloyl-ACP methyl ester carboxylesterase
MRSRVPGRITATVALLLACNERPTRTPAPASPGGGGCGDGALFTAEPALEAQPFVREDLYVPHLSTLPVTLGKPVGLFVRHVSSGGPTLGAVLFTSSGTLSSLVSADLDFKTYDFAEALARQGFDVYLMDQTGYGFSPQPTMDDPCNVDPSQQDLLIPQPLAGKCPPRHPHRLVDITTEWPEIDSVVDYIRRETGVEKVNLVGFSRGSPRMGGYAVHHPDKVARLLIWGPTYVPDSPDVEPPARSPQYSFTLAKAKALFKIWFEMLPCEDTFDPDIIEPIRAALRASDPLAATWGTAPGELRRVAADAQLNSRWNAALAARMAVPVLIAYGEGDTQAPNGPELYAALGTPDKILLKFECGTHYLHWERNHRALHQAAADFFRRGRVAEVAAGALTVDRCGQFQ